MRPVAIDEHISVRRQALSESGVVAFLRSLDEAKLITLQRSAGGHRRYSRYQLRIAARARELVDQGTPLKAACRIIILEDQLAGALELNAKLTHQD